MFIPIWIIIIILSAIGVVTWWGVLRVIDTLKCIDKNLGSINERLSKLETWIEGHSGQDDILFKAVNDEHKAIWQAIDKIRGT